MTSKQRRILKPGWVPMAFLLLLLGFAICFALLGKASRQSDTTIHWDMPVAYAESNYHTQNAISFAKEVRQCSQGKLDIMVHGSGSLYKGGEIKRAVQEGVAAIGERLLSTHYNENPLFAFDSLPFIATNFKDSSKLWQSAKESLGELMAEENLLLLYSVPWPPSGLYFNTAIESVEQMQKIKFRSYSAATARFAELSGMIPIQIEAAELNQALALGVVESIMASGSTGYDRKVWEHLSHFYDVRAWLPRNYVFVNRERYRALPQKSRQCLVVAANNAEARGMQKALELAEWYVKKLAENGIEIALPGEKLGKELSLIGGKMVSEWIEKTGVRGERVINNYRQQ